MRQDRYAEVAIVDIAGIKRSTDIKGDIAPLLAQAIDELVDALACDHPWLDLYLERVESYARWGAGDLEAWIRDYYVFYGWRSDG